MGLLVLGFFHVMSLSIRENVFWGKYKHTRDSARTLLEVVTSVAMISTGSEILEIHYCKSYLLLWRCVTQSYHQYQSRCL